MESKQRTGAEAFTGGFSYAVMPYDSAERYMRMFAHEVMPELKKLVPVEHWSSRVQRRSQSNRGDFAKIHEPQPLPNHLLVKIRRWDQKWTLQA